MEEEKNNKKIANISEKKEEKEFLARAEIRTMGKDTAELREAQAKEERTRVAQIKTEEEVQREKARQTRAEEAARARELAEKTAKQKTEELTRLRTERKVKEKVLEKEEKTKEETRAEGFKEVLKETQTREEEERKRFLARVEAKAEGKEEALPLPPKPPAPSIPPTPSPTPQPSLPEKPKKPSPLTALKKIPKPSFKRPSFAQKLWIRIVLSLLVLAVLAAIATFWYWYLAVREAPVAEEKVEIEIKKELIVPPALIVFEASQVLEISELSAVLKSELADNQFTRLLIKDAEENKILGLREFFEAFEINAPETFYSKVNNDFTLFVYSSQGENRLGLVTEVKEADLLYLLRYWEGTMEQDLENLFVFLGKTGPGSLSYFREVAYKDTSFRYLSFPPENFGICWTIVNDYLILTSSGESIIKTIDKLE